MTTPSPGCFICSVPPELGSCHSSRWFYLPPDAVWQTNKKHRVEQPWHFTHHTPESCRICLLKPQGGIRDALGGACSPHLSKAAGCGGQTYGTLPKSLWLPVAAHWMYACRGYPRPSRTPVPSLLRVVWGTSSLHLPPVAPLLHDSCAIYHVDACAQPSDLPTRSWLHFSPSPLTPQHLSLLLLQPQLFSGRPAPLTQLKGTLQTGGQKRWLGG
jgi:hypothetical protein